MAILSKPFFFDLFTFMESIFFDLQRLLRPLGWIATHEEEKEEEGREENTEDQPSPLHVLWKLYHKHLSELEAYQHFRPHDRK